VTVWAALSVLCAGMAAGTVNTVVGSGTLITFPTLLALGYPPVTANVSNNIGIVFGGITGTWGYRRELVGTGPQLVRLAPASFVGAVVGAVLLLRLPARAFAVIVPVLIAVALVLVVLQPRIAVATVGRRGRTGARHRGAGPLARVGTLFAGVYGGYFGAAQGVLLVGLLGAVLDESLQRVNAIKNFLSSVVNFVAAATFLVVSPALVDWRVVGLLAVGSIVGGFLGAGVGRRLPPPVLRGVIVVVGVVAIVRLLAAAL
jgi:uncharacterized membrane protein YfcA